MHGAVAVPGGGRACAANGRPAWLEPYADRLAELEPLDALGRVALLDRWAGESGLQTESGRAVRFVPETGGGPADPSAGPGGAARIAYEVRIHDTGEVPTRVGSGARHDLYNALAWLAWPRAKARLNALHAQALTGSESGSGSVRGPLRDATTLFDENAALWIGLDPELEARLRAFDWNGLFVAARERMVASVRVLAFGHALLEKLDAPFKAITAHAWPLRLPAGAPLAAVDAALADSLRPGRLGTRAFCPLPVLGVPGWCDGNRDPAFYNDPAVFRAGRRRVQPAHR